MSSVRSCRPSLFSLLTFALAALFAFSAGGAEAREKPTDFEVEPGPKEMSAEERKIEADPKAGVEHAVILLEREEWDQRAPGATGVAYHLRAKILSNEGRSLGDISIPSGDFARIEEFWARTIHPDGRVLELEMDALVEETNVRVRGIETKVLKGALPAVEPGVVIDFGYEGVFKVPTPPPTLVIQRSFPITHGLYRWRPMGGRPASYWWRQDKDESIEAHKGIGQIVFEVEDLPAIDDEPYMPPSTAVHATVIAYYKDRYEDDPKDFWDAEARDIHKATEKFLRRGDLEEVVASIPIPEDASFPARMGTLYDWVLENVENANRRTAEERELAADSAEEEEDIKNRASAILEAGVGRGRQIDRLYVGLARELGAEAWPIFVVDRTWGFFNPALLTSWQFDAMVVAIWPKGGSDEQMIVCDPSSGMPFGQIPWYLTGVAGVLFEEKSHRLVNVPVMGAGANVERNTVRITFDEFGEAYTISSREKSEGQSAFAAKSYFASLTPDKREEAARKRCGENAELEVLEYALGDFEDRRRPFTMNCVGEVFTTGIGEEITTYSFDPSGPWYPARPEFLEDERGQPIILRFPMAHHSIVTIDPPPGFEVQGAEPPVTIQNEFGAYQLMIKTEGESYVVDRTFVINALVVPPEKYEAFRGFLREVDRLDDKAVVFKRAKSGS